ncbi:MAG: carbamoyl phosphate synthase small subunit [Acutalibacteraceae bacterium]
MEGKPRKLVLEDGCEYFGQAFGSLRTSVCEVVFNTSMVGYQEVISDLAYADRMVVMTYPLIGNCGIIDEDLESKTLSIGGLIVRDYNDFPSNFRTTKTLAEIMEDDCVPGITGVDTRKLVKHICDNGYIRGIITDSSMPVNEAVSEIKNTPVPHDSVYKVSCKKKWYSRTSNHRLNIVVVDCGVRLGIIKNLNQRGCNVTVVPFDTPADVLGEFSADGILISNGPGDIRDIPEVTSLVAALRGKYPIFGIGLGCLAIAKAGGARIIKLASGHNGGNHPVQNLLTGKLETATQCHDSTIDEKSLKGTGLKAAYKNIIDKSLEGIISEEEKLYGMMYYYDISTTPKSTTYMLDRFLDKAKETNKNA